MKESAIFYNQAITFGNEHFYDNNLTSALAANHKSDLLQIFLDTNVVGYITLLTTTLMFDCGSYRSAEQLELSPEWENLSIVVLDIVSKMCQLNLEKSQQLFRTPVELYHLMLFWLHYKANKNAQIQNFELLRLIVEIVGRLSYNNPENTEMAQIGLPSRSLLQRLVNLPSEFYLNSALSKTLVPTLAILALNERNRMVIEEDLSIVFLSKFLEIHASEFPPSFITPFVSNG
jgi:hypothetical protein